MYYSYAVVVDDGNNQEKAVFLYSAKNGKVQNLNYDCTPGREIVIVY